MWPDGYRAGVTPLAAWRLLVLFVALVLTIWIGVRAATPPAALPADAVPASFSAGRAMVDVHAIAMRPHPTGTSESVRVSTYLALRMAALGLHPEIRNYLIDNAALRKLQRWSDGLDNAAEVADIVGILPGRDRRAPAVVLMAHYDTVWGSPGAGDDSAGVAAALEIVRAIRARGTPSRDVILLLTDGEEIGLSGARAFWGGDVLADRAGVVVNLETRGLGGRATMFETGPGNGAMMALFGRSVAAPVANSLAVAAYRQMPNRTDFSPVRDRGLPGFNFAFLGRAAYYHSPLATIDRLDPRSVQDLGDQAFGIVSGLAFADALPARSGDATFFDMLGRHFVQYAPATGWLVVLGAMLALAAAGWRLRHAGAIDIASLAAGFGAALWLAVHAALALLVANLLGGSGRAPNYYGRLADLPRLEAVAVLVCFAALAGFFGLRTGARRWLGALPAVLLTILGFKLGGPHAALVWLGLAGAVTGVAVPRAGVSAWGGWIGAIGLVALAAIVAQIEAPFAAWVLAWPALLLGIAAASAAVLDPRFDRGVGMAIAGAAAVIVSAPLLPLAHLLFLAIGAPTPQVLLLAVPTLAAAFWPIARMPAGRAHLLAIGCALVAAGVIAMQVRTEAPPASIPAYSFSGE